MTPNSYPIQRLEQEGTDTDICEVPTTTLPEELKDEAHQLVSTSLYLVRQEGGEETDAQSSERSGSSTRAFGSSETS